MSGEEQAPVEDGGLVGWLYYNHLKPNRYAFQHTESSRVINTRAWRPR
jgi:hypothetical protein